METLFRRISPKIIVTSSYYAIKCLSHKYNRNQANQKLYNYRPTKKQILLGAALLGAGWFCRKKDSKETCGIYQKGLPDYTPEEVLKHNNKESRIWISYKEGVYDITDYLEEHPGGDQKLKVAAGKNVESFWDECTGTKGEQEAFKVLETLRIGNLKSVTDPSSYCNKPQVNPSDYGDEPKREQTLNALSKEPFVGGPMPTSQLTEHFLTPNDVCYIHNHSPVPYTDLDCWKLRIEIQGKRCGKIFSLAELKKMPSVTVTASMQCASNRSIEMAKEFKRPVQDSAWDHSAICTAEWTGVLLLDVLKAAGFNPTCECNQHVQFESVSTPAGTYATSIPLWKVLDEKLEVILAYEMNGKPLSRDHGFPLRLIIPGATGSRWVKWLYKVRLQDSESCSEWHKKNLRLLAPTVSSMKDIKDSILQGSPPIFETPVTSAICCPANDCTVPVKGGLIHVEGYAFSGGGQKIIRVEVSIDRGSTWLPAKITCNEDSDTPYHWSWALWTLNVPVPKEAEFVEIWARATDSSFNSQPKSWQWNFSGVGCNAIHKIQVACKK